MTFEEEYKNHLYEFYGAVPSKELDDVLKTLKNWHKFERCEPFHHFIEKKLIK